MTKSTLNRKRRQNGTEDRNFSQDSDNLRENGEAQNNTQVVMHEDDAVYAMDVGQGNGEESFFHSKSSEEENEDDTQTQQRGHTASEGEISDSSVDGSTEGDMDKLDESKHQKQKIADIDNEMLTKMKELHKLMAKQGLKQSAGMLQECMDSYDGETADKRGNRKYKKVKDTNKTGRSRPLTEEERNVKSNAV